MVDKLLRKWPPWALRGGPGATVIGLPSVYTWRPLEPGSGWPGPRGRTTHSLHKRMACRNT